MRITDRQLDKHGGIANRRKILPILVVKPDELLEGAVVLFCQIHVEDGYVAALRMIRKELRNLSFTRRARELEPLGQGKC